MQCAQYAGDKVRVAAGRRSCTACSHPTVASDLPITLLSCREHPVNSLDVYCSQVAEFLQANLQVLPPDGAFVRANMQVNAQLHQHPGFDDSLSGTTAVAALLRGRTLFVSNVGDSRCVLAELQEDKLIARDMSVDQTPFRQGIMGDGLLRRCSAARQFAAATFTAAAASPHRQLLAHAHVQKLLRYSPNISAVYVRVRCNWLLCAPSCP